MNKKKIGAIILTIVMGMTIVTGCGKKDNTVNQDNSVKITGENRSKEKESEPAVQKYDPNYKPTEKEMDDIFNIYYTPKAQRGINNFKKEVQNINGNTVTVYKGTYTKDPRTGEVWIGGKKMVRVAPELGGTWGTMNPDTEDVSKYKNQEKIENAYLFLTGPDHMNTKITELIKCDKAFSRKVSVNGVNNVLHYGKVIEATNNGIKLDDGKFYNLKNACIYYAEKPTMKGEKKSNYFSYNKADFPKNTFVQIQDIQGNKFLIVYRYFIMN